jgi:hypothetical protein
MAYRAGHNPLGKIATASTIAGVLRLRTCFFLPAGIVENSVSFLRFVPARFFFSADLATKSSKPLAASRSAGAIL